MTGPPGQDTGEITNPALKLAVSVVMLRDSPLGIEVFVQHRASTMDFAASAVVFPGGRVDAVDSVGWTYSAELLNAHATAWRHTCLCVNAANSTYNAGRLVAAAAREVMEECGISLSPEMLKPWANWVTPEGLPKRFDTYFFATRLPAHVQPLHQTTEASSSHWLPVRQLIDKEAAGTFKLLPPTLAILDELLRTGTVAQALESERTIEPVRLRQDNIATFWRLCRTMGPSKAAQALNG